MPWRHQFAMIASEGFGPVEVVTVERILRDEPEELRPVAQHACPDRFEPLRRLTGRVVLAPVHVRRQGSDQYRLRDALRVAGDIASHLTATRGVADVDRVAQVEVLGQGREVGNPVVHVVAGAGLVGPAVAAPVVGDHPVAVAKEEVIWASQSSADSGQPWLKTIGWPDPQSL